MNLTLASASNLIGGGYAASCARWVWSGSARRVRRDFFGLAVPIGAATRSMLAGKSDQAEAGGRAFELARRILGNGGKPSLSVGRFGHVARRHVARTIQGTAKAAFLVPGGQIANLTTGGAVGIGLELGGAASAEGRGGVSPLSIARAAPHAGRVRGTWSWENLPASRPSAGSPRECLPGFEGAERSRVQMGSGVREIPTQRKLTAGDAESSRHGTGRGDRKDHHPLDAGEAVTVTPLGARVNGMGAAA